jgi:hypothetical protein
VTLKRRILAGGACAILAVLVCYVLDSLWFWPKPEPYTRVFIWTLMGFVLGASLASEQRAP